MSVTFAGRTQCRQHIGVGWRFVATTGEHDDGNVRPGRLPGQSFVERTQREASELHR
jgi:hypothetical protein